VVGNGAGGLEETGCSTKMTFGEFRFDAVGEGDASASGGEASFRNFDVDVGELGKVPSVVDAFAKSAGPAEMARRHERGSRRTLSIREHVSRPAEGKTCQPESFKTFLGNLLESGWDTEVVSDRQSIELCGTILSVTFLTSPCA
jgi:hypothetical protein